MRHGQRCGICAIAHAAILRSATPKLFCALGDLVAKANGQLVEVGANLVEEVRAGGRRQPGIRGSPGMYSHHLLNNLLIYAVVATLPRSHLVDSAFPSKALALGGRQPVAKSQHHSVSLHPQNTQHLLALFELPQTIHGVPVVSILGSNHMSPAVPHPQSSFEPCGMWC